MNAARLVLLGAIAALGSLAIQLLVPALPAISGDLGINAREGQLLITAYLAVLAVGQLGWAPVADRHGRRPVILGGLVIFIVGTLACTVAHGFELLLAGRVVQGIGGSSSLVTARAMATDRADAGASAAPLAILTSITLISPALAPIVGGLVVSLGNWRWLFVLLAAAGTVALLLAWRFLPETGQARTGPAAALFWRYGAVVRSGKFLPLAAANMLASAGFYLFLAVSPFELAAAGATPTMAGFFYSVVASAIIAGTLLVPPLTRWRPAALWPLGSLVLAAGALAVAVAAIHGGVLALLGAMTLVALGSGLSGPALLGLAIERQRNEAASVASLYGTLQMGGAALLSTAATRLTASVSGQIGLISALMLASVLVRQRGR